MVETIDFTIRAIEALPLPTSGRTIYADSKVAGLRLRVSASGLKAFSYLGRPRGGAPVRINFGRFPAVKPEEARRLARECAGSHAAGADTERGLRAKRRLMSVGELFTLYIEEKRRTVKRPEQLEALWDLYIAPRFARMRLADVTARDIARWHEALPGEIVKRRAALAAARQAAQEARARERASSARRPGPAPKPRTAQPPAATTWKVDGKVAANRALECLRGMFNFALSPRRGYFEGVNPAGDFHVYPEVERERYLLSHELPRFFAALAAEPNETHRDFILTLLLTAMRRANVASMRWAEIDMELRQWSVPGQLMKNGRPHTVPLGPEMIELLQIRRVRTGDSAFVFPSRIGADGQPESASGHVEDVRNTWKRILRTAAIDDLRRHDLRRTLASWQAKTGASLLLIGKSLAHRDTSSTAIYARLDLDPVRDSIDRATTAMFSAAGIGRTAAAAAQP